jgi:large subunit ribosomal protein L10
MNAEKTLLIEDVLRRVNASPFLLVVDYTGLKVDKFAASAQSELKSTSSRTTSFAKLLKKQVTRMTLALT